MRAGRLRHRITVFRRTTTAAGPRGGGEVTYVPDSDLTGVPALVTLSSPSEGEEARRPAGSARAEVLCRYFSPAPGPEDRIEWDGRTLHVVGSVPDADRRSLTIECGVVQ